MKQTESFSFVRILLVWVIFRVVLFAPSWCLADTPTTEMNWPPEIGSQYPNLRLIDGSGKTFALDSLKGKVIIVELSAMSCPASQALTGAHRFGGFRGVSPQPGLPTFEEVFERYSKGLKIKGDPDLALVQIVFYDMDMKAPSVEELRAWIAHFKLTGMKNYYIVAAPASLTASTSREMMPGFHLIDKKFTLRKDATGARQQLLYTELIPAVGDLVGE